MFQFEVVVTESCNLNCEYCYMVNKNQKMTRKVFDAHYAALPKIMNIYGEKRFTTTLFGGEPLLNWGLIEHILPIVSKDPKCQGITLPTNGLLIQPYMIDTLKKYNVNISLSFDGLWQENKNDTGLFRFREIRDTLGIKTCKVMIPPQSQRKVNLKQNYEWFVEEFGMMNPDFTLVRDDVWYPLDISVFKFEIKELADQTIEYIKQGIETLPGIFSLYILDTLFGKKYGKRSFGCFAGIHGLGFMPDGKVYPCARFGSKEEYEIFSSTTKSENNMIEKNYKKFLNKNITDPRTFDKCKQCILYEYCNAGCTYSQLKNGGVLDSVCELYKASYEQAFRIVDELKDNKTFKKIMNNLTGRLK